MIADEPTRLTSVGETPASSPGSTNCSRMKKANAEADQRGQPAQPRDQPDDDGEGERQHDDRRVALVVEEAVRRPALGAGVAGEDERVALLDAVGDDVGGSSICWKSPVARRRRAPRRPRRHRSRDGRVVPQSKASTDTTRASGYVGARRQWTSAACCGAGRLVARPEHEQAETVASPTGTRSSSISQTAAGAGAEGLRARRRGVRVGTVAVGVERAAPGQARSRDGLRPRRHRGRARHRRPVSGCSPSGRRPVEPVPQAGELQRPARPPAGRPGRRSTRRGAAMLLQLDQHGHAGGVHEATPPQVAARRAAAAGARAAGRSGPAPAGGGRPR